jgi:hypothetical protein
MPSRKAQGREALASQFADLIESGYELGRPSLFGDAMPEVSALQVLENAVRRNAETDPRPTGDALSRAEENGAADIEPAPGADRGLDRQSDEAGAEALAEADIFSHGADLGERPVSGADIADTMRERFEKAGRPADEAEAAATVLSTFYSTMAARLGRSLNSLLKIAPLPEVRRAESEMSDADFDGLMNHIGDIVDESELRAGALAQSQPGNPAFDRWFGDSKVVDAEGKPLVVYHGTGPGSDIEAFLPAGGGEDAARVLEFYRNKVKNNERIGYMNFRSGSFFSPKPEYAGNYTAEGRGSIYPVYIKAENPIYYDMVTRKVTGSDPNRTPDALILTEKGEINEIAVIDPTQIKSVNNRGTFDPNDPRILYQPAWHGTPHIFDKFEWSDKTRGKGEGAQAFGDGLYFAGKKQVAEHYRNVLSGGQVAMPSGARLRLNTLGEMEEFGEKLIAEIETLGLADERFPDGTARALLSTRPSSLIVDAFNSVDTNAQGDSIIAAARNWLAEKQQTEPDRLESTYVPAADARAAGKAYGTAIKLLDELEAKGLKVESGRLYKVDIPGDDELMLWDAPMSEQPAGVIEKLLPFAEQLSEGRADVKAIWEKRIRGEKVMGFGQMTGDEFYRLLSRARIKQEPDQPPGWGQISAGGDSDFRGDAAASAALREAGIPGHRFLDGGSRGSGEGSYNYVIYDDSRVNITEFEQGIRGLIEFGDDGRAVMSMFDAADASTALHESAHWFLKMFRGFAEKADAPADIKADWDRVRSWWTENADAVAADSPTPATRDDVIRALETGTSGDPMIDLGIEIGMQEQWARGFEAYLREGVAPNEGLRGIFEQFKRWLTGIYRNALDLNVNINDDIRGVFDRLLAQQQGDLVPNSTAPKPDPVPDGLDAAAAAVRTPADPLKLGAQYGLDDAGGFAEQADIDALKASDMLTPEDQAMLDEADQLVADAEAYGKTLETAAWCMR